MITNKQSLQRRKEMAIVKNNERSFLIIDKDNLRDCQDCMAGIITWDEFHEKYQSYDDDLLLSEDWRLEDTLKYENGEFIKNMRTSDLGKNLKYRWNTPHNDIENLPEKDLADWLDEAIKFSRSHPRFLSRLDYGFAFQPSNHEIDHKLVALIAERINKAEENKIPAFVAVMSNDNGSGLGTRYYKYSQDAFKIEIPYGINYEFSSKIELKTA